MNKQELFIQLVEALSAETLFHGHAVIDAEDEAMMVMMFVLNEDVEQILSAPQVILSEKVTNQAFDLVEQRLKSLKPMAYVIGEVNFSSLKFIIDERALVPRSPIAELIMNGFQEFFDVQKINSALDLCTGSGCIGISLAQHHKHIAVDLSDLSNDALDLAHKNIALHKVQGRVNAIHSDLFDNIEKKYDLIITNPPYVSEEEYSNLPTEYKQEPKMGLVTEQSGLKIPVNILYHAADYLEPEGYLILEVGYTDELLASIFPEIDFNWINFSHGGQGVCVFNRQKLLEYHNYFKAFLESNHVL